jgi:uncharacterized protein
VKLTVRFTDFCLKGFLGLSGFAFNRPVVSGLFLLVLAGVFGYLGSTVKTDNSYDAYFVNGDPSFEEYKDFQRVFGSDEFVYVLLRSKEGKPLFDREVLALSKKLGERLGRIPYAKKVHSLTQDRLIISTGDDLSILTLDEIRDEAGKDFDARKFLMTKDFLRGNLISEDGEWAAVFVEMKANFLDQAENTEGYSKKVHDEVAEIMADPAYGSLELLAVGDPLINHVYNSLNQSETAKFIGLTILVVSVVLVIVLRSAIQATAVILIVILSLLSSLAVMALFGWQMNLLFVILPSLLLTYGIADATHLLANFQRGLARYGTRREALMKAVEEVWMANAMTTLTIILGLLSLVSTPIRAIREFGVYSSVGMVFNILFTFVLVPALVSRGRGKASPKAAKETIYALNAFEKKSIAWVTRSPVWVTAVFLAITLVSVVGIRKLQIESNWIEEFNDSVPIKQAYLRMNGIMGGTGMFTLVLKGEEKDFSDPEFLGKIERFQKFAEGQPGVSKTISMVDLIKDINVGMNGGKEEFRAIPPNAQLISQYLLAYQMSGGEELGDYLTRERTKSQISIRIRMGNTNELLGLFDRLQGESLRLFGENRSVMTGISSLSIKMASYIQQGQIQGFGTGILAIALCMVLFLGSFRVGLLSMLPNLFPIVVVLGAMGWLGIKLDYVKMLISSISLGIIVDDTIHFFSRFQRNFKESGNVRVTMERTFVETGKPMMAISIILIIGFMVNVFSSMDSLKLYGLLSAFTIFVAYFSDIFLGSALLTLVYRRRETVVNAHNGEKKGAQKDPQKDGDRPVQALPEAAMAADRAAQTGGGHGRPQT